ncbi:MAG TPA: glutaredoxin family protein [Chloroflexi bacterium]|nr:glutaredoxin family protein [Chloroflexota bacterium]
MAEIRGYVEGSHAEHEVLLYALSTCIWCRKTRQFLESEGVAFKFVYVDLVDPEERKAIRKHIRQFSDRMAFPTLIVDDEKCIVGVKPDAIKARLGL